MVVEVKEMIIEGLRAMFIVLVVFVGALIVWINRNEIF